MFTLKGITISNSKHETGGKVLKSTKPVSFFGGISPLGKVIDKESDIYRRSIKNKMFVFPEGKGSTVGSFAIYQLKYNCCEPLAIITEKPDIIVATGAILSNIPMISKIDISLINTNDKVIVSHNKVIIENVEEIGAVTSFIMHKNKILILKRSNTVRTHKGKWACVSGYLEPDDDPETRARTEIKEEVGLTSVKKLHQSFIYVRDKQVMWGLHIFLFKTTQDKIKIDWEHTEYKWIYPSEIKNYDTVPSLVEAAEKFHLK